MNVDELIAFAEQTTTLTDIPRTGWLMRGVHPAESVAAHSYGVVAVALWIADTMGDADAGDVARIAVLHDVAEAQVSDIPGPVKKRIGEPADRVEAEIGDMIAMRACSSWSGMVERYRAQVCLESQIVKAADRIQMRLQAVRYHVTRRGDVAEFLSLATPESQDPRIQEILDLVWDRTRVLDP